MVKHLVRGLPAELRGRSIRILVGSRLQARRKHLGFAIVRVARELGIKPSVYEAYEAGGEQAPAFLLAEAAELFGVSVLWFFEDVFVAEGKECQTADCRDAPPVYRVATLQDRLGFLADSFCKLDLEGQQQVLAVAAALSNEKPARARRVSGAWPRYPRRRQKRMRQVASSRSGAGSQALNDP